jgi:hypothetical protein
MTEFVDPQNDMCVCMYVEKEKKYVQGFGGETWMNHM